MKRFFAFSFAVLVLGFSSQAQFKNLLKKDSSGKNGIDKLIQKTSSKQGLSNDEIVQGLKEALSVGANNASKQLSSVDGFFKDACNTREFSANRSEYHFR